MISYKEIRETLIRYKLLKYSVKACSLFFNKIETDSRSINENDVFVCISGFSVDGHEFAEKAILNGAKLLIVERELRTDIAQFVVSNSRKAAAVLAKLFFDDPTSKIVLVGITGTNGKTTTTHIIEHVLLQNNIKVGVIGTLGYFINGKKYESALTTPDIIDLNKIFVRMISEKVHYIIMEVSSHSIALDRIYELNFKAGILTNITHDHLDFHHNFEKYVQTKFLLFEITAKNHGLVFLNLDDKSGRDVYRHLDCEKFGISSKKGDIQIRNCTLNSNWSSFELQHENVNEHYKTNLTGKFNVYNLSLAISLIKKLIPELSSEKIKESVRTFKSVPGRLEKIGNVKNLQVYLDYAHTPNALENVLQTLSEIKSGRLICLFGAGGNRDKTKRSKLLETSLKLADLTIITTDNPRFEEPSDIIRDITNNADPFDPFWIIRDRQAAIRTGLSFLKENDILLIAGKGHETYQEIKGNKIPFSDKEEVIEYFQNSDKIDNDLSIPIDPLNLEILFQQRIENDLLLISVSTDSRTIQSNSLFFALSGDNFDGHKFVPNVLSTANCMAVVDNKHIFSGENVIIVEDTLEAYSLLAKKYRSLFDVTSIALTGSVGKTTTKEYIYNVLSEASITLKTYANENNIIGLSKTIFRLKPVHKYAIFEIGANHFGEIKKLSETCDPDIGIITAAGKTHLEFFKDEDGVFKEKTELFKRNLKLKFFPSDDERFSIFSGNSFGQNENADYRIKSIQNLLGKTKFLVNNRSYEILTSFDKFVLNATIAIALASEMNIDPQKIQNGLSKELDISQRMQIKKNGGQSLLIDCYNANPDSMKAAIDFWIKFHPAKPHIAILGDMLEMGKKSRELHREISEILRKISNKTIISVGQLSQEFNADKHFPDVEKLIDGEMAKTFPANSIILIKASHSIHLEKFVLNIEQN